MRPDLFRRTALERLSTPDKLDVLMTIARPHHWVALLSILFLIVACFVWSVTARIPVLVTGTGVLALQGEQVRIPASEEGQITDIGVEAGQRVERGQTVARIFNRNWETSLAERSGVTSLHSGTVLQVLAFPGQWVRPGDPLIVLETRGTDERPTVTMYVPLGQASEVRVGTEARIWPMGRRDDTGGALTGRVLYVSALPAGMEEVEKTMGSRELAADIMRGGPVAEVRVGLVDAGWPEAAGSDDGVAGLQTGMLCRVDLFTGSLRPIDWIF